MPQPIARETSQIQPLSLDLSLAEGVDKELTCAICLGRYKHPKVLPCLHTYCKSCLEGLSVTSGSTSKLTCPQCKEIHEVPSGGIDSFKTYFTINNLIELLHIHEVSSDSGESGKAIQCESGLDENPAVARCLSCSEYLCESCYGIHQRLKATRDHNMITLEKIKKSDKKLGVQSIQRKQYCEEHDDEVLKLFCKTCNKVICRDCALVKHREHDYAFIREVRPETRNQLEVLLKEVQEKEHEFQGHKKHIEELQRSNGDTLNSCLKDVNEMCDKLIEEIETRRAYLIAELHSKHEAEEEQNKGEMNSVDLSLVRLSDSIRFTRKLLDDGNDVELMTVGIQAIEALAGLSTMAWNRETVRPSLLRLKFASVVDDMKSFGKVLNTIQSSDILIEIVPQDAYVGDELEFNVKLTDEISTRKFDAAALLSITVMYNMTNLPASIQNNGLNNWKISCTPQDDGEHTIVIRFGQFASQLHKFVAMEDDRSVQKEEECAEYYHNNDIIMPMLNDNGDSKACTIKEEAVEDECKPCNYVEVNEAKTSWWNRGEDTSCIAGIECDEQEYDIKEKAVKDECGYVEVNEAKTSWWNRGEDTSCNAGKKQDIDVKQEDNHVAINNTREYEKETGASSLLWGSEKDTKKGSGEYNKKECPYETYTVRASQQLVCYSKPDYHDTSRNMPTHSMTSSKPLPGKTVKTSSYSRSYQRRW